jgi:Flp pilus assembly protein TadG
LSARQLRDETGATAVIVALVLIALFAMIVITVDVGGLLLRQRAMVNGSDAGALAAARSCSDELDTSSAESQSDTFAIANVSGLVAANGGVIDLVNCDNGAGYVTVEYSYPQQLFFAPVLGFANTSAVVTQATAAWGPLGGGRTVPIIIESGTLQGPCAIPDGARRGDTCPLYYNNGNQDLGNADWGFLNLDQWGIAPDARCSDAGSADRRDWILNDYDEVLRLNGNPPGSQPTYVCVDTGASAANWMDLDQRIRVNDILLFPVNDCTDQRNRDGSLTGCDGTPDKYSVIGFVKLRVVEVFRGDEAAAIGTPGASGTCDAFFGDIANGQTFNLNTWGDANCAGITSTPPDSVTNLHLYPRRGTEYTACATPTSSGCAYYYDPATRNVTWRAPSTRTGGGSASDDDVRVVFDWAYNGTPGACGIHPSDPNARCVVTEWIGFSTTGGDICDGPSCEDFGAFGYVLCDRELGTCPGQ